MGNFQRRFPFLINGDSRRNLIYSLFGKPPNLQDQRTVKAVWCFLIGDFGGPNGIKYTKTPFVLLFVLLILLFFSMVFKFPPTARPSVPLSSKPSNNKLVLSKLELKATQGFPGCWEGHTDYPKAPSHAKHLPQEDKIVGLH